MKYHFAILDSKGNMVFNSKNKRPNGYKSPDCAKYFGWRKLMVAYHVLTHSFKLINEFN